MKHAYLIIAHNEFEILQKLISALDDERNDIYVHIDKKAKQIPILTVQYSNLFVLERRIDVRWGHISQIECEYILFEEAYKRTERYARYHLISGTHLPLKTQDEIHAFFDKNQNTEIMSYIYTNNYEVRMKLGKYHFFLRNYRNSKLSQLMWHILLKVQYVLHISRKSPKVTIKANNWVSLTDRAVVYIISKKSDILKKFRYSFCGDEFFVPYLFENSSQIFDMVDCKNLLYNNFEGRSTPRILSIDDYDFLISSDYLFARKFSLLDINVVNKILMKIKNEC